MMTKVYLLVGSLALITYLGIAARGIVFSGTDGRPSHSVRSSTGRRSGGGFFWGVGGYRGGK